MFQPLKTDIASRFAMVDLFFRASKDFKGDLGAATKGLIFVQVYAVYEFTVRSVIQVSIDAINNHQTKLKDMHPPLMALFLDSELKSLRDCGKDNVWTKRLEGFSRAFSKDIANLSNSTRPPSDGSHYRHSQLIMICDVFGIKRLPVRRKRHLFRIDEVVNNRNQIAHGSETAEEVGRRYTRPDIQTVIEQMKSVCFLLIAIFEGYCADGSRHRRR